MLRYCRDFISASLADDIGVDAFEVEIGRFRGGNRSRAVLGSVKEQYMYNGYVTVTICLFFFRQTAPIRYVTKDK